MEANSNSINEEWIRKKLNINQENLDDIKTLSLPGTYQEKICHLGSSLFRFIRLKELDLSRNTLISLEGLENLKLLEKLNLYYNNIGSLKELERLKYNTSLAELDLRLNPITKEENDYRLFLISIVPSLRILDDRGIRDSERQMAVSLLNQGNHHDSRQNGKHMDNAIVARVKSVSNIAKRSAGLCDTDDIDYRPRDSTERFDEYSPRTSKESQNYDNLFNKNHENEFLNKSKSCSMLNLRSVNNDIPRLTKQKSVHFNEIDSYYDLNSYRSCSDTHFNMNDESEHYTNFRSRANFTPNPHYDDKEVSTRQNRKDSGNEIEFQKSSDEKGQIYALLDLVDRYWNGSKSLHKNGKFLNAAKQIMSESPTSDNSSYHSQIKSLQDENRRLNNQLNQKSSKNDLDNDSYKGLIGEIENLKKKYMTCQEENKSLRKELNEKNDRQKLKEDALSSMEAQNNNMKRDIEIMKIKLKQYEQLQQLTSMLQESHKSLVSTNEHLLQEINVQKQFTKPSQNQSRLTYTNDVDLYSAGFQMSENLIPQMFVSQDSKNMIRKQFEQISQANGNRFSYPVVK